MNSWEKFNEKYRKKFKDVPIHYAFNQEHLQELKEELGITSDEEFESNTVATYGRWNYIKKGYSFT